MRAKHVLYFDYMAVSITMSQRIGAQEAEQVNAPTTHRQLSKSLEIKNDTIPDRQAKETAEDAIRAQPNGMHRQCKHQNTGACWQQIMQEVMGETTLSHPHATVGKGTGSGRPRVRPPPVEDEKRNNGARCWRVARETIRRRRKLHPRDKRIGFPYAVYVGKSGPEELGQGEQVGASQAALQGSSGEVDQGKAREPHGESHRPRRNGRGLFRRLICVLLHITMGTRAAGNVYTDTCTRPGLGQGLWAYDWSHSAQHPSVQLGYGDGWTNNDNGPAWKQDYWGQVG